MSRDDAMRALESTDWTDATVETTPRQASMVYSARFPAELAAKLEAEATRRGVTPSALIRDLVDGALTPVEDDAVVTLRVADLRQAIDTIVRHAA